MDSRRQGGTGKKPVKTTRLIEDVSKRHVAFSKRRPTLFALAGDLSALCGAHTAVVVFSSPSTKRQGKAYAFGSPSVDAVLRRHVDVDEDGAVVEEGEDDDGGAALAALRREVQETRAQVAAEKARMKGVAAGVERAMAATPTTKWWETDVDALGLAELPEFEARLRRLRDAVQRKIDALSQGEPASGQ